MSKKTIRILLCIPLWGSVILWFYTFTRVIKGEVENKKMVKLIPLIFIRIVPVVFVAIALGYLLARLGISMTLSIILVMIPAFYLVNYIFYKLLRKNNII